MTAAAGKIATVKVMEAPRGVGIKPSKAQFCRHILGRGVWPRGRPDEER
jgi:hypothetical protein